MASCTPYRTLTSNASGSVLGVALSLHGLGMIKLHSSARIHLFRSNRIRASLARLTDQLSLVEFIHWPPLLLSFAGMRLIELLWSWAMQWNFTMSPLLHILSASVPMCNVSKWFSSSKPGAAVPQCTVATLMSTQGMWVRVDVAAKLYIKSPRLIAFNETQ